MVAPNYSQQRSELAKTIGLGQIRTMPERLRQGRRRSQLRRRRRSQPVAGASLRSKDSATKMTDAKRPPWLRICVLILAGGETLFWLSNFQYIAARTNPLGDGMEWLAIVPMTAVFVMLTLPALILGIRGRGLRTALVLTLFSLGSRAVSAYSGS
jgi:hypothetical protein